MDCEIKEVEVKNYRRLKVGFNNNENSKLYLFPEFIESVIINYCMSIIKEESNLPNLQPKHVSFSVS